MRLIQRWWAHPADFAWTAAYHRSSPLLRHAHAAVGVWCWLYAAVCVLATHTPAGMPSGGARIGALALGAVALVIGGFWMRGPWPSEGRSRAFVAFLEVSTSAALLLLADPFVALPCAAALGVNGSYIAAFHGPKMFLAHQAWAVAVTGVLFVDAVGRPDTDVALACAYLILLTLVLFSAPVLTQALLLLLRGDAASAFYDPLTGLRNRRGLDTALTDRVGRYDAVSILVVDLDNFKQINDRFGHAHGDVVLRAIADDMSRLFTSPAVTARTGGEEFVIVVGGDPYEVTDRAIALLMACAQHDGGGTTVSIGVCHTNGATLVSTGFDQPYDRADRAMYAAKKAGGNTIRVDGATPFCDELSLPDADQP